MLVVPERSKAEKVSGVKAVVLHDPNVADESCQGLDETNLTVCHRDKPLVDKSVGELVSWVSLHDIRFCLFVGEGNSFQEF